MRFRARRLLTAIWVYPSTATLLVLMVVFYALSDRLDTLAEYSERLGDNLLDRIGE